MVIAVPRYRRSKLIVAAAILAAGLAGGVTWAVASDEDTLVDYAQNEVTRGIGDLEGLSAAEALGVIFERLPEENDIASASLGAAPPDFELTDRAVEAPPELKDGKWLYFTVKAQSDSWEAIRSVWEADLVAGVFRDAMHALGETLFATRIALALPDGRVVDSSFGGLGDVTFHQQFDSPDLASSDEELRDLASREGLKVLSIDYLKIDQIAPILVLETSEPARVVHDSGQLVLKLFGDPPRYEGYYLEVRDSGGDPVFVQSTAFRAGAGRWWVRPDLDDEDQSG